MKLKFKDKSKNFYLDINIKELSVLSILTIIIIIVLIYQKGYINKLLSMYSIWSKIFK